MRGVIENRRIREAFAYCERLAKSHYENFPVASAFLPAGTRPHVAAVYAFARTADDFADELPLPPQERLTLLDDWERQLRACAGGSATHPIFIALGVTLEETGISRDLLADLLTAYRMDVRQNRFMHFADLVAYCRCSANPVGRLVLQLFHEDEAENLILSDSICTGLQLANFWQDISVDWRRGRLYLPLEDLDRFGYHQSQLESNTITDGFRSMLMFEVERAEGLLNGGVPLLKRIRNRRLRFELALTIRGGLAILRKIRSAGFDVLRSRPGLSTADKLSILFSAAVGGRP